MEEEYGPRAALRLLGRGARIAGLIFCLFFAMGSAGLIWLTWPPSAADLPHMTALVALLSVACTLVTLPFYPYVRHPGAMIWVWLRRRLILVIASALCLYVGIVEGVNHYARTTMVPAYPLCRDHRQWYAVQGLNPAAQRQFRVYWQDQSRKEKGIPPWTIASDTVYVPLWLWWLGEDRHSFAAHDMVDTLLPIKTSNIVECDAFTSLTTPDAVFQPYGLHPVIRRILRVDADMRKFL